MKGDALIQTQRLMAQTILTIAHHVEESTGFRLKPVAFALLPSPPVRGMIACITDSTVTTGVIAGGGGTNVVLAWHNGTSWKVMAA